MNYISKYKCRYCGEVFKDQITGNEKIAYASIIRACVHIHDLDANVISDMSPHIKPDHYGIGDLIGVEIEGGET